MCEFDENPRVINEATLAASEEDCLVIDPNEEVGSDFSSLQFLTMQNCGQLSVLTPPTIKATSANIPEHFKVEIDGDQISITVPEGEAQLDVFEVHEYTFSIEYTDDS